MTRWFPIAPGTTLPAAPVAVNGQITVTRTVPVWNETVLISAKSGTAVSVESYAYSLGLTTSVSPIVTRSRMLAAQAAASAYITHTGNAPQIRTGASVSVGQVPVVASALTPGVTAGKSVFPPTASLSIATLEVVFAGRQRTQINPSPVNSALSVSTPTVATGARVSVGTASVSVAGLPPIKDDYFASMNAQVYGWDRDFQVDWWAD